MKPSTSHDWVELTDAAGRSGRISATELQLHSNPASSRYWGTVFHTAPLRRRLRRLELAATALTISNTFLLILTIILILWR